MVACQHPALHRIRLILSSEQSARDQLTMNLSCLCIRQSEPASILLRGRFTQSNDGILFNAAKSWAFKLPLMASGSLLNALANMQGKLDHFGAVKMVNGRTYGRQTHRQPPPASVSCGQTLRSLAGVLLALPPTPKRKRKAT